MLKGAGKHWNEEKSTLTSYDKPFIFTCTGPARQLPTAAPKVRLDHCEVVADAFRFHIFTFFQNGIRRAILVLVPRETLFTSSRFCEAIPRMRGHFQALSNQFDDWPFRAREAVFRRLAIEPR
jgi:hypothetical protein